MPFMKIIKPGLLTTIQDRGRFSYQKWGVPVAGAMDEYALRVGNMSVGNQENEGCLEITLLGPVIEFLQTGLVALTGADLGAKLNQRPIGAWESFLVTKGDILQFTGVQSGCRCYLAVAGGIKIPVVMGSTSTYLRGGIGGISGRALSEGDELELKSQVNANVLTPGVIPAEYRYKPSTLHVVRVVLGPQDDAFTKEGINTFLQSEYRVTHESDRMGCRLQGPRIEHKSKPDIISDGIPMGSIQVPGNGSPIVMMADRQTIGGYTKIATVITPDLWKLAQANAGDGIKFTKITLAQAHRIYKEYENMLDKLPHKLKNIQEKPGGFGEHKKLLLVKVAGRKYRVEIEEI
ncbi:MAG: biotin-dependent carboxyltransferase family protein [Firmicutes bacterium]|nr:biotin-dependent carboxyltransferase family protein [Bacillota bacterium]